MGCDYYIIKVLRVFLGTESFDIELERIKGYFDFDYDEDEYDYTKKFNDYVNEILTPKMNPIVIYSNNNFVKPHFEMKYKTQVEDELKKANNNFENVTEIIKIELRH
jgi:chromosomal replication initiation ATPase DnaA